MTKTLFDHLSHICERQQINYYDNLEDADKKTFSVYMINRFLSMNIDYLPVVNEMQRYWDQLTPREVYLFYSQLFPKKKQYNKYIKCTSDEGVYDEWLIKLISDHYTISSTESAKYLTIFYSTDSGKIFLKKLIQGYGIEQKKIKKAGL